MFLCRNMSGGSIPTLSVDECPVQRKLTNQRRSFMELREVIASRRSIRKYKDIPVSDEILQDLLDAAMSAPSAVNFQPWYFVVIRSKEHMEKLGRIMEGVSHDLEPALRDRFRKHPQVAEESIQFIWRLGMSLSVSWCSSTSRYISKPNPLSFRVFRPPLRTLSWPQPTRAWVPVG